MRKNWLGSLSRAILCNCLIKFERTRGRANTIFGFIVQQYRVWENSWLIFVFMKIHPSSWKRDGEKKFKDLLLGRNPPSFPIYFSEAIRFLSFQIGTVKCRYRYDKLFCHVEFWASYFFSIRIRWSFFTEASARPEVDYVVCSWRKINTVCGENSQVETSHSELWWYIYVDHPIKPQWTFREIKQNLTAVPSSKTENKRVPSNLGR